MSFEWLKSLAPWDGKEFSPLEVPRKILAFLGDPQNNYPSVHIAGTNGKGTVASLVSHLTVCSGKFSKVGLMTSPHLIDVRERCLINSDMVESSELEFALSAVRDAVTRLQITPTYFVGITCATFFLFSEKKIDLGVIEVGLGGLYDATNLMENSLISIVTSIGLDHQEILGSSVADITRNKLGIIKEGQKVIIGDLPKDSLEVLHETLGRIVTNCYFLNQSFYFDAEGGNFVKILKGERISTKIFKNFLPDYMKDNLALAICCVDLLDVELSGVQNSLKSYFFPRRFNLWQRYNETVIVDGAHNFDGIKNLLSSSEKYLELQKQSKFILCFNFLKRKNWTVSANAICEFLRKKKTFQVLIKILEINENFVSYDELKNFILDQNEYLDGIECTSFADLSVIKNQDEKVLKIVFGSLSFPDSLEHALEHQGYVRKSIW